MTHSDPHKRGPRNFLKLDFRADCRAFALDQQFAVSADGGNVLGEDGRRGKKVPASIGSL